MTKKRKAKDAPKSQAKGRRNPMAQDLADRRYRPQATKDPKAYDRHRENEEARRSLDETD